MFSFQLSQTMILSSKCSLSLKYPAPECSKQNNIFTEHKSNPPDCDADEPGPVDLSVPAPGLKSNINVVI